MELTEQTKQVLEQAQLYQQQMQVTLAQKESLTLQDMEIKNALTELKKAGETEVYRASGPVLIKGTVSEVKKSLEEKKDAIDTRMKILERNEKKLEEKLEELRHKLARKQGEKIGG